MVEHVGKKRRKEVREAANMQLRLRKDTIFITVGLGIGLIAVAIWTALNITGVIPTENMFFQMVPMLVIFVLVMFLGQKAYRLAGLRDDYKAHCSRFSISKDEIKAFTNDQL